MELHRHACQIVAHRLADHADRDAAGGQLACRDGLPVHQPRDRASARRGGNRSRSTRHHALSTARTGTQHRTRHPAPGTAAPASRPSPAPSRTACRTGRPHRWPCRTRSTRPLSHPLTRLEQVTLDLRAIHRRPSSCVISRTARARNRSRISVKSASDTFPIARSNSSSLMRAQRERLVAFERGTRPSADKRRVVGEARCQAARPCDTSPPPSGPRRPA